MKHFVTLFLFLLAASVYATPIPQPGCLAPKPKAAAKHVRHAAKAIKVAAAPLLLCEAQPVSPWPLMLTPPVLEPPIAPPPAAPVVSPPDEVPAALPPPPMLYPMSWYEPIFSEGGGMEFLMPPSVQYNVTQTKAGNVTNSYSSVLTNASYVTNNIDTTHISNVTTSTSSVVNNAVTNTTTNNKTVIVNAPPEHHERVQKAPELDSSGAASAATFLIGCVLVLNGRRPRH